MLYLIGLGLNVNGISQEGLEIVKRCKQVYLENYTVNFPYSITELEEVIEKKIIPADRKFIEGLSIVDEAKKKDVALLIYGSPLTATTHITLIEECKASGVKYKILYNASVFDAIAETGLQLYKFGKIASMPKWQTDKNYEPDSFMEIIQQNLSMKAHSLILIDPGMNCKDAIEQLEKSAEKYKISLKKIIICQCLGTRNSKIMYRNIEEFREFVGVKEPYSMIIPSKLHFMELEVLKGFE